MSMRFAVRRRIGHIARLNWPNRAATTPGMRLRRKARIRAFVALPSALYFNRKGVRHTDLS